MSSNSPILATVSLSFTAEPIPLEGLKVSPLRVELAGNNGGDAAWIAELTVLGDLPWCKGEKREVEVRVMSDEFRSYMISKRPKLLVKRASEIIGNMELV